MTPAVSIYLDLVRFGAALAVFAEHSVPWPWFHDKHVGIDAVFVFFVLSGYVIAHVAERKEPDVTAYAISRLSRLWSVAIPALALACIADLAGLHFGDPAPYVNDPWFSTGHWVRDIAANAFFVNEFWFWSFHPLSDGPFWSLGFEFWYYAAFAAWFYWTGRRRVLGVLAAGLVAGPKIMLLFPVWALGVAAYRLKRLPPPGVGWALAVGTPALYVALKTIHARQFLEAGTGSLGIAADRWVPDQDAIWWGIVGLLVAAHFVGVRSLEARLAGVLARIERPVRWAAGCTLSLYLFHEPLLHLALSVLGSRPVLASAAASGFALAASIGLGLAFEPQRHRLRRWLWALYRSGASAAMKWRRRSNARLRGNG